MTDADLFSLSHFSGNSHRCSSPPQSHPTWPSSSLCSPQWSPSSPLTPSWLLSTSSCDPGDKMEEIVYFMWSILLTESLMSPERRVLPMTLTRTPQIQNNSKILQLFNLYSPSAKNHRFLFLDCFAMEGMWFDGLRVTKQGLSVCRNTGKSDMAM